MRSLLIIIAAFAASVAHAADYSLPAANQGWWTPHTAEGTPGVGVPGGFLRFTAGGAEDRAVSGTVRNVVTSYNVATNNNKTTGTIAAGSNLLTVADTTGFAVGNYIQCGTAGTPSAFQTVVNAGASSSGNITITMEGTGTVSIAVTAGDANTVVAAAIRAATFTGYTTGGSGNTVTYTATTLGAKYSPSFGAGGTGVTVLSSRTATGVSYFQIASIAGNVLTLTANSAIAATDGVVKHDASVGINAAIAAASSGDVVYIPAGTYGIASGLGADSTRDGITLRGAGDSTVLVWNGAVNSGTLMSLGFGSNSWEQGASAGKQTVTGAKTKGTSVIEVTNASLFQEDGFATMYYQNEEDDTRIAAGTPPTWTSQRFATARKPIHRIVLRDSISSPNTITIEPPIMMDGTNGTLEIAPGDFATTDLRYFGVEDMTFITDQNVGRWQFGLNFQRAVYCWAYNLKMTRAGSGSNGNCLQFTNGYRNEVRRNTFIGAAWAGASAYSNSDGAIQYGFQTGILIEDNSFVIGTSSNLNDSWSGETIYGWDVGVYGDGQIYNSVHSFNLFDGGVKNFLPAHGEHGAMNLFEGNYGQAFQGDSYHANSSYNTFYRNLFSGRRANGDAAFGGGWMAALGRFTRQWALVGNIFGRDGTDTLGDVSYGNPFSGGGAAIGTAQPSLGDWWADWADYKAGTFVTRVPSAQFTGFAEQDLDVEVYTVKAHNYESGNPTGAVVNSTADTLPASLIYTAKPDWFGDKALGSVNPDSPTFDYTAIPAGHRWINGNEDYLGPSAPSFSTNPATQTATVGDNVTLTVAGNGNPSPTLQWRKGASNISGATSSSLVLTSVQLADAGSYDVVATNTEGTATSTAAVLTVNASPSGDGNATVTTLNATTLNLP